MEEENAKVVAQIDKNSHIKEERKDGANKKMLEPQEQMVENEKDSQTKGNDFGLNGWSMNEVRESQKG